MSTGLGIRGDMLLLSIIHIRESAYSVMGTTPKTVGRSLGICYITWQNNCSGFLRSSVQTENIEHGGQEL